MRLAPVDNVSEQALVIRRFDREKNGRRIPFYEFNQVLGKASEDKYDGSYGDMADFIYEHAGPEGKNGFKCNIKDARILFRRVLVDILIGNTDAHLKNFALIQQNNEFRLTPNYDLLSASMYGLDRREKFTQFALKIGGKKAKTLGDIDAKSIILLAYEFQLTPQELLEDVRSLKSRLDTVDSVMAPLRESAPSVVCHLEKCLSRRWNGGFDQIETTLQKRKPKNIFANKTSRKEAEKSYPHRQVTPKETTMPFSNASL